MPYRGKQLAMQNLIDREETVSHEGILFWHPNYQYLEREIQ
jgi:hypothetical protein